MTNLTSAVESAPVSSLHTDGSTDPDHFPVPTSREEQWRFTPLNRLRKLHADAPLGPSGVTVSVEAAPEVVVETHESAERFRVSPDRQFLPTDRVSARAFAAAVEGAGTEVTVITVPKEAIASAPTYVRVTGSPTPVDPNAAVTAGHLVIDVQPYGRATVVIDQTGSATYANNVEIHVADGGDLTVVALADWAGDTVQVAHHVMTLGRDAHVTHFALTLGGSVVRLSPSVHYTGPGGDAELYGVSFADAGQHLEHRLFIDHTVPNCRSRVAYKSALSGDGARTIWIGDVLIRPEATDTDTYEYNRNLVLTDGTFAESVPNLEILTGEVINASHASASGRLQDEHLFYLRSRGIPLDEARRLVIRGFFGELIAKIGVPELEERITASIESELS